MAVYHFGRTTFANNISIGQNRRFTTPQSVLISPDGTVNLRIEVIPAGATSGESVATGRFSSDVNFPINHLTSSGGQYTIRLNNAGFGTAELNGGSVYY
ncbi:hypothetical protein [Salinicoccus kekensis]|uniref:hypothetical protein n=1 Tax=Salinicoccus kekensis TaxID=714307 RepID=UPI00117B58B1|nr:hypothetical protein [Salinicoccus kekensis]